MRYLTMALMLAASSPLFASTSSQGTINTVQPIGGAGLVFFQNGSRDTRPACATAPRWVIDVSSNTGQVMASTLLTAYSLGKKIVVVGTGNCYIVGDTETVYYIATVDN
jgi:hypothetical protein